jgi:hypothetical protein
MLNNHMHHEPLREGIDRLIDHVEMLNFNNGFEAALSAIDDLSNDLHNKHQHEWAEALRWAVKEMKGENIEADDFLA